MDAAAEPLFTPTYVLAQHDTFTDGPAPDVGTTLYAIRVVTRRDYSLSDRTTWRLQTEPPRTIPGGHERPFGWLGSLSEGGRTTNRYGAGLVTVERVRARQNGMVDIYALQLDN